MGPKKKSEKSLQMEDADDNSGFHGTKKKHRKITSSWSFRAVNISYDFDLLSRWFFWFFSQWEKSNISWGIEKFWDLKKNGGKKKIGGFFLANPSPIMSHDQRMVHQWLTSFFRSSDQRMGLLSTAKIQSKVQDQRSWSLCGYFRTSSCWVLNQLNPFILVFSIWGRVTPCNTPQKNIEQEFISQYGYIMGTFSPCLSVSELCFLSWDDDGWCKFPRSLRWPADFEAGRRRLLKPAAIV